MKPPILFSDNILFVEFFIRQYRFNGKGTIRTSFPRGAFFYTGTSKALGYEEFAHPPILAFEMNKPFLSDNISTEIKDKTFKDNTNIVGVINGEFVDKNNRWWKNQSKLFSNKTGILGNQKQLPYANFKSLSPYGFNIIDIKSDGTIETDFPRDNIILNIHPQQTLCFLCRKEERGDGEWYTPNVNLVMFVKNYGFHKSIEFRSQADINRMSEHLLCDEKFSIRDFRKSSLNFELG